MFPIENLKVMGNVSIEQVPETTNNKFDYSFFYPNNSINCDGVIDYFKQGQTGDCYLLAALESMSNTPEGRYYIKQSVKKHFWGDVTVYFKGIDKTYIITQDELQNAPNLSSGDDDVKAFEIAMAKYRTEILEKKQSLHQKINLHIIDY